MADQVSSNIKLEIGHVLFIDIVGYSKLLITDQSERLQKLKEIVWGTEQFRQAQAEGKLLRLPTGDGGALVFRNNSEAPVRASQFSNKCRSVVVWFAFVAVWLAWCGALRDLKIFVKRAQEKFAHAPLETEFLSITIF